MKKKSIMSIIVIAMVSVLMIGATMSWFTDNNADNPITNTFSTGIVKIVAGNDIDSKNAPVITTMQKEGMNPGDIQLIPLKIKNMSSDKIFLRFKVTSSWDGLSNSNVLYTMDSKDQNNTNWTQPGQYSWYYYTVAVDKDEIVSPDLCIKLDGASTDNTYRNHTLTTVVTVEAVQEANDAVTTVFPEKGYVINSENGQLIFTKGTNN